MLVAVAFVAIVDDFVDAAVEKVRKSFAGYVAVESGCAVVVVLAQEQ